MYWTSSICLHFNCGDDSTERIGNPCLWTIIVHKQTAVFFHMLICCESFQMFRRKTLKNMRNRKNDTQKFGKGAISIKKGYFRVVTVERISVRSVSTAERAACSHNWAFIWLSLSYCCTVHNLLYSTVLCVCERAKNEEGNDCCTVIVNCKKKFICKPIFQLIVGFLIFFQTV